MICTRWLSVLLRWPWLNGGCWGCWRQSDQEYRWEEKESHFPRNTTNLRGRTLCSKCVTLLEEWWKTSSRVSIDIVSIRELVQRCAVNRPYLMPANPYFLFSVQLTLGLLIISLKYDELRRVRIDTQEISGVIRQKSKRQPGRSSVNHGRPVIAI